MILLSPRRPSYFILEPLAIAVAMMAGALLLIHSFTKKSADRPRVRLGRGSGNGVIKSHWPLLLAGAGGLAALSAMAAAPGLAALLFPVAILSALALGVAMSVRRSVLRR